MSRYTARLALPCWMIATVLCYDALGAINDANLPRPAYLSADNFPRALRDQYCGAYAVWHALRHFGRDAPIGEIVDRMRVNPQSGVSLASIYTTLQGYGLKVRAVRLRASDLDALTDAFVPYIRSAESPIIGHVGLCVPLERNRCMVFDGAEPPAIIDLHVLLAETGTMAWDGTALTVAEDAWRNIFPDVVVGVIVVFGAAATWRIAKKLPASFIKWPQLRRNL